MLTLSIGGGFSVQDPTDAQIHRAVWELDSAKGDAFLILEVDEMTYVQISGDPAVGFDLEYQRATRGNHFRAEENFSADEIVAILQAYKNNPEDWSGDIHWQPVR